MAKDRMRAWATSTKTMTKKGTPSGAFSIRRARQSDAQRCHRLGAVPELAKPDGGSISRPYYAALARRSPLFFVAEARSRIAGFVLGEPLLNGLAICHLLVVAPRFRRLGIGRTLMGAFERACRSQRHRLVLLYAFADRPQTVSFFRRCGYTIGTHVRECTKRIR